MFAVQRIIRPEIYQGRKKKKDYFEGWYFLQISGDSKCSLALIPGISMHDKEPHAFIQAIFSVKDHKGISHLKTGYFRFPISDFKYQDKPFSIQIGCNIFSNTDIVFNLEDESLHIQGHFHLGKHQRIRQSILTPNIMGFFGYFSFMECYHGVISMRHTVAGEVSINGIKDSWNNGTGYIEKDWGRSFPKEYVWIQCNHFHMKNTSLMFSAAHIPFLGTSFKGFLCNLVINGTEYRWATYNRSKIVLEDLGEKRVRYQIKRKNLILTIEAEISENAGLKAPREGRMEHEIKEGLLGEVYIQLADNRANILYEDYGNCAGVEIVMSSYHA